MAALEAGQISRAEIKTDHDLTEATLGYWLRKYRQSLGEPSEAAGHFIDLGSREAPSALRLNFGDGVDLQLDASVSPAWVARLIHTYQNQ